MGRWDRWKERLTPDTKARASGRRGAGRGLIHTQDSKSPRSSLTFAGFPSISRPFRYNAVVLRLQVSPAQGSPYERLVDAGPLVIGRSTSAGLVLADPFLSRHQARLVREGNVWKIEDLGSRNGTWVDGHRIETPTPLQEGTVVTFSQSRMTVLEIDASESEAQLLPWATVFRSASEVLAEEGPTGISDFKNLQRRAERLQLLTEVHRALGASIALDELLQLILDRIFDLLRPEEGVIFLRGPEGELEPAAYRSASGGQGSQEAVFHSRTLEREVVDKGLAALALDTREDTRFAGAESLVDFGVRSLLAAPLLAEEGEALGMIVLTSGRNVRIYSEEDLSLLVSLAAVAALRIRNVALAREAFERRQLEREVELARRIQVRLLPETPPLVPGWEVHAGNRPSRGVSGDIYQVIERVVDVDPETEDLEGGTRHELVLMVADVAGKGIAAALLTATLEALAAGPIERGLPPEEIATWLSQQLRSRTPVEKYATLFLAALDTESGVLRWANAGHLPALLLRESGDLEHLDASGPPVGLIDAEPYPPRETELHPGDLLLLYTDGITEATDPQDEEMGQARFEDLCCRHAAGSLHDFAEALDRELEELTQGVAPEDDRTLVAVRRLRLA